MFRATRSGAKIARAQRAGVCVAFSGPKSSVDIGREEERARTAHSFTTKPISEAAWNELHVRTGHMSPSRINTMIRNDSATGLPTNLIPWNLSSCDACMEGKMRRPTVGKKVHFPSDPTAPPKRLEPFEVVGVDIFELGTGPAYRYVALFLDFCSDSSYTYSFGRIDQYANRALQPFIDNVVAPAGGKVLRLQHLQSDYAPIYSDEKSARILTAQGGASHRMSAPYTQAQNGRVERRIGLVKDTARAIRIANDVPARYKDWLIHEANRIVNSGPTASDPTSTPLERSTGRKPDFGPGNLPFWSVAYAHNPRQLRGDAGWDRKAHKCRVLGPDPLTKDAYKVLLLSNNSIVTRYKVTPSRRPPTTPTTDPAPSASTPSIPVRGDVGPLLQRDQSSADGEDSGGPPLPSNDFHRGSSSDHDEPPPLRRSQRIQLLRRHREDASDFEGMPLLVDDSDSDDDNAPTPQPRRSRRPRHAPSASVASNSNRGPDSDSDAPSALTNGGTSNEDSDSDSSEDGPAPRRHDSDDDPQRRRPATVVIPAPSGAPQGPSPQSWAASGGSNPRYSPHMPRPIAPTIGLDRLHGRARVLYSAKARSAAKRLAKEEKELAARLDQMYRKPANWRRAHASVAADSDDSLPPTPRTMKEAREGPNAADWEEALVKEIGAIEEQGTYVDAPQHRGKTVKSKLAFRVTREADGVLKFKVRLVAKGFTERPGIDFFSTFSPVAQSKSIHALLHIGASEDWDFRHTDIGAAYLESDLDTELYMQLPPELDGGTAKTVRLVKSIYGLKQSGELWNKRLHGILTDAGFTRTISDPCVYVRIQGDRRMYLAVYVDDILATGSHPEDLLSFEALLATRVKKVKSTPLKKFVGMDIARNRSARTITLSQGAYLRDVAESEGLTASKDRRIPAEATRDLYTAERGEEGTDAFSTVGKIRYPADHSCPETLFIASQLGSAVKRPGPLHLAASRHLIQYLKGRADLGLTLGGHGPIKLECWADASLVEEGTSTSQLGYCMRLNDSSGMFCSRSMRSRLVCLSSTDAELRALLEAAMDIEWARVFLAELGYPQTGPTRVYEDNSAVMDICESLKASGRTKYLNKVINFIRERFDGGMIKLKKVKGTENVADILTKPLAAPLFLKHRATLLGLGSAAAPPA